MVAVSMIDEVSNAFEAFVRRWAERQGLFEQRTHRRMLEYAVDGPPFEHALAFGPAPFERHLADCGDQGQHVGNSFSP
jgi:hypothetical protein